VRATQLGQTPDQQISTQWLALWGMVESAIGEFPFSQATCRGRRSLTVHMLSYHHWLRTRLLP
jgi:hypothetical protein